ncbi:MAG: glycosyltransferase [Flavobacteriia bacterium]|nr:glycosyltransferase [Flavobacteriia bacterium]
MKITFLSTLYPYRGGIAQFNANLYRELEKQEHTLQAVTFTRQYPNFLFPGETQLVTEKDTVDPIPTKRWLDSINPFTYWSTARKIRQFEPELLITKYWMTFFGPSLGTVAKRMRKSTTRISILDNVIPHEHRFFDKPFNRFFLKHNDGFVVMSDSVLKDLLSLKPDAKYLRIDHPLYDHFGKQLDRAEACAKLGIDPSKKIILFFGFIRDYKGLDILLDATASLSDDYCVVVAGEVYGSFEKYEQQIIKLGIQNKLKLFNHYIGDQEVPLYFSAADVCVLPYKSATQSGITSIAMHFNLPIIATDTGGLKELVQHEKTGLIVDQPDAVLLSESIKRYFDEGMKQAFAQNLEVEKAKHSWANFAAKLINFSKEISRK